MTRRKIWIAVLACALSACASDVEPEAANRGPLPGMPVGSDVFLATLTTSADGAITLGALENVTNRAGYDNQPFFTPDGSGIWYTVIDDHSGQADIWRYDLVSQRVTQVIASAPESEYSATPLPDGSGISVIRVEADSLQRLWRFDLDGGNPSVLLPDLAPVGYHKWVDNETVVMFVLGRPATLRIGNIGTGTVEIVGENVGRSIHNIPGSDAISFVQRFDDGLSGIMWLDPSTGVTELLAETIEGGDYHAWTPSGTLLQGHESKLYAWMREPDQSWVEIADFSEMGISISRLAVSPDGSHIAIVGEAN